MTALWCLDCRAPSAARCLDDMHDVRNPRLLLRQCLGDVVPRAVRQLGGLQDGVPDDGVLAALRLLRGAPSSCRLTLQQDGKQACSAEWAVDEDPLLQALVVALAVKGRLLQVSGEPKPTLEPSSAHPRPAAVLPPAQDMLELVLGDLSQAAQNERQDEKAATLALVRQRGVRRMTKVYCNHDPAWVLDVLRSASPTVEELSVGGPGEQHLAVVHAMPRLRRLRLDCGNGALDAEPPLLPPAPGSSLRLLRAAGVPRPTLASLLRAHSASLDELWLGVGTPGPGEWPRECRDLDALLAECGLRVSRVVLQRWYGGPCCCGAQLAAVRRVLPTAKVQCRVCDHVPSEDF